MSAFYLIFMFLLSLSLSAGAGAAEVQTLRGMSRERRVGDTRPSCCQPGPEWRVATLSFSNNNTDADPGLGRAFLLSTGEASGARPTQPSGKGVGASHQPGPAPPPPRVLPRSECVCQTDLWF